MSVFEDIKNGLLQAITFEKERKAIRSHFERSKKDIKDGRVLLAEEAIESVADELISFSVLRVKTFTADDLTSAGRQRFCVFAGRRFPLLLQIRLAIPSFCARSYRQGKRGQNFLLSLPEPTWARELPGCLVPQSSLKTVCKKLFLARAATGAYVLFSSTEMKGIRGENFVLCSLEAVFLLRKRRNPRAAWVAALQDSPVGAKNRYARRQLCDIINYVCNAAALRRDQITQMEGTYIWNTRSGTPSGSAPRGKKRTSFSSPG